MFSLGFHKELQDKPYNLHYVKSVPIQNHSGPYFSRIFWHSNLSVFSPNICKSGKNADQNNSEYGHFLRCDPKFFTVITAFTAKDYAVETF